jgi:polyferredoxin
VKILPGRSLYLLRLRAWFQVAVIAALAGAVGRLYAYTLWLWGQAPGAAAAVPPAAPPPVPPLVEAFLPGQALAGARVWLAGHGFDPVHPAGLTIFLAALAMSLLARRGFCAFFCPVGYLCEGLNRLGRRLSLSRRPGRLVSTLISLPKYLLLALLLWFVFVQVAPADLAVWLLGPANKGAASDLLRPFLAPSANLLIPLGLILAGSVLVPGFWCRGFCPYGALLGLLALFSPLAVWRDRKKCTYCRRCTRLCPARLPVHEARRVSGPECRGCLKCLAVCPEPGCLTLRAGYGAGARRLPGWVLPLLCALVMGGAYLWAVNSGHWESPVLAEENRLRHLLYQQFQPALPP